MACKGHSSIFLGKGFQLQMELNAEFKKQLVYCNTLFIVFTKSIKYSWGNGFSPCKYGIFSFAFAAEERCNLHDFLPLFVQRSAVAVEGFPIQWGLCGWWEHWNRVRSYLSFQVTITPGRAGISWRWLNACLPRGSGQWIPACALLWLFLL